MAAITSSSLAIPPPLISSRISTRAHDLRILGRGIEHRDHVANLGLAFRAAQRLRQLGLARAAAVLLDQVALERQRQRGVVGQMRTRAAEQRPGSRSRSTSRKSTFSARRRVRVDRAHQCAETAPQHSRFGIRHGFSRKAAAGPSVRADHRAHAPIGQDLQQQAVVDAAVDDVHRIDAACAPRPAPRRSWAACRPRWCRRRTIRRCGAAVRPVIRLPSLVQHAGRVGQQHQLLAPRESRPSCPATTSALML